MKAPEKTYLQVCGDCHDNECDNCKFEDLEDNVTWCKDKIFDKDIEYTHTDALLRKQVTLTTILKSIILKQLFMITTLVLTHKASKYI